MDAKILHELFEYRDGNLYWKVNLGTRARIGNKVGSLDKAGYVQCKFNGKMQKVHRIIFLMNHGWLPLQIDHIDLNKSNNKIENLRAATISQNQWNRKIPLHNKSGIKGVSWCKREQKWRANIAFNKKYISLGYYKTLEEAAKKVQEKRAELHGKYANHG